jgi:hypothetical protein
MFTKKMIAEREGEGKSNEPESGQKDLEKRRE